MVIPRVAQRARQRLDAWRQSRQHPRPPGPPAHRAVHSLHALTRDTLGFVRGVAAEYGDLVYCPLGVTTLYIVSDPALIEQVLLKKSKSFMKDRFTRNIKRLLGEGLVTSESPLWKRQRKLIAPPLQRKQIARYAEDMVAETTGFLDETWRDGDRRDLLDDMSQLTLRVVVKTLFDARIDQGFDQVHDSLEVCLRYFQQQEQSLWFFVPPWLPTRRQREFEEAVARIDRVLSDVIAAHRANSDEGHDLLSLLLRAVDEDGHAMNDVQLRDEAITMFLAGHETTALALTYALDLIAKHPAVEAELLEEIDRVLEGRAPGAEDVRALALTDAVIREGLRLHPTVWTVGREAIEDVELGGYIIPKGAQVITPQIVTHLDARWFDAPEEFRPHRWLDGSTDDLHRFAYFPFGGGPRVCIGNHFAMMEATLLLATMLQRFRVERVPPLEFTVLPSVTVRPTSPLPIRLHAR